jgi:mannosyltransferase
MALTLFTGLYQLHADYYWGDERFTLSISTSTLDQFIDIIKSKELNMSLYYLLMRFWVSLGKSEFIMRLPSVFFGFVGVYAIYFLGRKIISKNAGLFAAFLLSINLFYIKYMQEARSYAMLAAVSMISSILFINVIRNNKKVSYVIVGVVNGLLLYVHFFSFLLTGIQIAIFYL